MNMEPGPAPATAPRHRHVHMQEAGNGHGHHHTGGNGHHSGGNGHHHTGGNGHHHSGGNGHQHSGGNGYHDGGGPGHPPEGGGGRGAGVVADPRVKAQVELAMKGITEMGRRRGNVIGAAASGSGELNPVTGDSVVCSEKFDGDHLNKFHSKLMMMSPRPTYLLAVHSSQIKWNC